ncbi:MAG: OsmC family peroxiredoxin [Anaerolineae bacterium]
MSIRTSKAAWNGDLKQGKGRMALASGLADVPFTYNTRFAEASGTNPEELIGAAQAGCFSMYLSAILSADGFTVRSINTTARVHLEEGPTITLIELDTVGDVAGIDAAKFKTYAERALVECPVGKALKAVPKQLTTHLAEASAAV